MNRATPHGERGDPIELVPAGRRLASDSRSSALYSSALSCLTCITAHSSREPLSDSTATAELTA